MKMCCCHPLFACHCNRLTRLFTVHVHSHILSSCSCLRCVSVGKSAVKVHQTGKCTCGFLPIMLVIIAEGRMHMQTRRYLRSNPLPVGRCSAGLGAVRADAIQLFIVKCMSLLGPDRRTSRNCAMQPNLMQFYKLLILCVEEIPGRSLMPQSSFWAGWRPQYNAT